MEPLDIRPAELADLGDILVIERASFRNPFTEPLFQMELKLDVARLFVAIQEKRVVGYIDFWMAGPEVHLINIAVHPDLRRRQVGRRLMDFLLSYARRHQVRDILLDVRTSNQPAITLYEEMGFERRGRRRGYYSDNGEDAWVMGIKL